MKYSAINLKDKLAKFSEHWSPKIIAKMNDYHFKLVKFQGDFVWHNHPDTDEVFITLDGEMSIEFRDGKVDLKAGEVYVVPLSLDLLQAEDGVIRLVLRAIGEETFSGESKQTCFDGEEIYLELWQ